MEKNEDEIFKEVETIIAEEWALLEAEFGAEVWIKPTTEEESKLFDEYMERYCYDTEDNYVKEYLKLTYALRHSIYKHAINSDLLERTKEYIERRIDNRDGFLLEARLIAEQKLERIRHFLEVKEKWPVKFNNFKAAGELKYQAIFESDDQNYQRLPKWFFTLDEQRQHNFIKTYWAYNITAREGNLLTERIKNQIHKDLIESQKKLNKDKKYNSETETNEERRNSFRKVIKTSAEKPKKAEPRPQEKHSEIHNYLDTIRKKVDRKFTGNFIIDTVDAFRTKYKRERYKPPRTQKLNVYINTELFEEMKELADPNRAEHEKQVQQAIARQKEINNKGKPRPEAERLNKLLEENPEKVLRDKYPKRPKKAEDELKLSMTELTEALFAGYLGALDRKKYRYKKNQEDSVRMAMEVELEKINKQLGEIMAIDEGEIDIHLVEHLKIQRRLTFEAARNHAKGRRPDKKQKEVDEALKEEQQQFIDKEEKKWERARIDSIRRDLGRAVKRLKALFKKFEGGKEEVTHLRDMVHNLNQKQDEDRLKESESKLNKTIKSIRSDLERNSNWWNNLYEFEVHISNPDDDLMNALQENLDWAEHAGDAIAFWEHHSIQKSS